MPTFELAASRSSQLFSSSISVVVIGLMLFMAYRLYRGNKRSAYRNLLISLAFIIMHHLLQVTWSVGWLADHPVLRWTSALLQVLSFVVMNFAIFELYYKRRARTRLWFYGLLAIGLMLAGAEWLPGVAASWTASMPAASTPLLDSYLLLLVPLFALMFGPHIGQPRKYGAGLAAVFTAQLCRIIEQYFASGTAVLNLFSELLSVVYYGLLFMLLFDRVVELLMSAWRSSITDGLTNLYNRRYFTSQLERALRSGKPVSLLFCDIDNFKRLNDTHGHHRADGVLKQVAAILMEETEGIGLAGRYGGEELVAFISGPPAAAMQTADSIRSRTAKESIVTISVGVSTSSPDAPLSAEQLLKQADKAMYHSKSAGKNRVTHSTDLKHDNRLSTAKLKNKQEGAHAVIPLPPPYVKQMKSLLGAQADAFFHIYAQPRTYGLRIHRGKLDAQHPIRLKMKSLFNLQPIAWCEDGYQYAETARPGRHLYHAAGLYYIQEPSAMIAAELLDPQPGEIVLDLAAAPGGKSTQIAAKMQGQGLLVANEIHPARAKILSGNIERLGIVNCVVTQASPEQLATTFPAQFDRILLDAPCSGEGMFRKDPDAVQEWSPTAVEACATRQRHILKHAAQLLKPGGSLVYATCTFNRQENEETIADFVQTHPGFRLIKEERMWPHLGQGEGHYAALLMKDDEPAAASQQTKLSPRRPSNRRAAARRSDASFLTAYDDFARQHLPAWKLSEPGNMLRFGDAVYWLPTPASSPLTTDAIAGLRVLRPGLHLGNLRAGGRFEPAHALAMAVSASDATLVANWPVETPEASAWCRGETIPAASNARGWGLALADGFALGWFKASGGQLKNHRPKGLRI